MPLPLAALLASPVVAAGVGAVGSGIMGALGSSSARRDRKEQRRQFDLEYGLDREKFGYQRDTNERDHRRRAALDPAKQQMLAALMQRLGLAGAGGAGGGIAGLLGQPGGPTPGFNPQAAPPPQMAAQPAPPTMQITPAMQAPTPAQLTPEQIQALLARRMGY